jgi:toxin ParE1/3/4
MSYKVIVGALAESDLIALYTYICAERQDALTAINYLRRIRQFCQDLGTFPERGRKRDDIRRGLRLIGFEKRIVIAFHVTEEIVDIKRIFYGGRDYANILGDDGER